MLQLSDTNTVFTHEFRHKDTRCFRICYYHFYRLWYFQKKISISKVMSSLSSVDRVDQKMHSFTTRFCTYLWSQRKSENDSRRFVFWLRCRRRMMFMFKRLSKNAQYKSHQYKWTSFSKRQFLLSRIFTDRFTIRFFLLLNRNFSKSRIDDRFIFEHSSTSFWICESEIEESLKQKRISCSWRYKCLQISEWLYESFRFRL